MQLTNVDMVVTTLSEVVTSVNPIKILLQTGVML